MPEPDPDKKKDAGDRIRSYMRYSGMAVQMGVIILLGTLAGQKLDAHFQLERPYLTILLALCSIAIALYWSLKDLINPK